MFFFCVTSGKSVNLSLSLLICKMGLSGVPISLVPVKIKRYHICKAFSRIQAFRNR